MAANLGGGTSSFAGRRRGGRAQRLPRSGRCRLRETEGVRRHRPGVALMKVFQRGCDDFLAKPFSYGELRLRLAALLRRARERPLEGRLRVGELEIDPVAREVRLRGVRVTVSQKEF